jgi:hypothetical protein
MPYRMTRKRGRAGTAVCYVSEHLEGALPNPFYFQPSALSRGGRQENGKRYGQEQTHHGSFFIPAALGCGLRARILSQLEQSFEITITFLVVGDEALP